MKSFCGKKSEENMIHFIWIWIIARENKLFVLIQIFKKLLKFLLTRSVYFIYSLVTKLFLDVREINNTVIIESGLEI